MKRSLVKTHFSPNIGVNKVLELINLGEICLCGDFAVFRRVLIVKIFSHLLS